VSLVPGAVYVPDAGLARATGSVFSTRSSDEMKSRMIMVMALLLVFSAGLAQPLHAAERVVIQTQELDCPARGGHDSLLTGGSGETGETQGDPDGWLGGQNFRPTPPLSDGDDLEQAPSGTGGIIATLLALLQLFMVF
jgi:hypothetical protein